jgi:hypothetical protein
MLVLPLDTVMSDPPPSRYLRLLLLVTDWRLLLVLPCAVWLVVSLWLSHYRFRSVSVSSYNSWLGSPNIAPGHHTDCIPRNASSTCWMWCYARVWTATRASLGRLGGLTWVNNIGCPLLLASGMTPRILLIRHVSVSEVPAISWATIWPSLANILYLNAEPRLSHRKCTTPEPHLPHRLHLTSPLSITKMS